MSQNPGIPLEPSMAPGTTACSNCHLPMPSELRFCRNCGYRLGEGAAEYTETVRFQNGHHPAVARATAGHEPLATSYGLSSSPVVDSSQKLCARKRKISGMTWIFISLLGFFLISAALTAMFAPRRSFVPPSIGGPSAPAPQRSFFGVDGFETADGEVPGVTFGDVEPPDSPADKAGLIGGDIITSYDGQAVDDDDRMGELLRGTPIGKTVDVVYIRDGEKKTTKLTTISKEEGDRLSRVFDRRPEGKGFLGYDNGERVKIEGTELVGVKLGKVNRSNPADLAGIKPEDVVVQFGDTPIRTDDELRARIRRTLPYSTVDITLYRGTEKLKIPVKLGKQ